MPRHVVEIERRFVDRYPAALIAEASAAVWSRSIGLLLPVVCLVAAGWHAYTGQLQDGLDALGRWAWWAGGAASVFLIGELIDGCGELWSAVRKWSAAKRYGREVLALPMNQRVVEVPVYRLTEGPLGAEPPAGLGAAPGPRAAWDPAPHEAATGRARSQNARVNESSGSDPR